MLRLFFLCISLWCSAYADSNDDGLSYLNRLRTDSGLIPLTYNTHLHQAATRHAKYLIYNQHYGHYETEGKAVFFAKTPSKRAIKSGYPSTYVMENISTNTPSFQASIDALFAAIYHRFVFLDFDKDEIGIARKISHKKHKIKQLYVYNLGSSQMAMLCKMPFMLRGGLFYCKELCENPEKMIPQTIIESSLAKIQNQNREIVLYPYDGQKDIWPAFYNESPDPLPGYKVSGFPISVQFNPLYTDTVEFSAFRLYDERGKEIKQTKILSNQSDPNHRLDRRQFALMPLKRLRFDHRYHVLFEGTKDGRRITLKWSFQTKKFDQSLYTITQKHTKLKAKRGETLILYIRPKTKKDILTGHISRGGVKVEYLDQNTLKVTLPQRHTSRNVSLEFKKRKVIFILK